MSWQDIALTVVVIVALWGAVWLAARHDRLNWRRNMFGQTKPRRRR